MTRFAALDGLRGISAVAVALFHLPIAFHLFTSPLVREAYIFVDFFFVLSGFVMAHAYGTRLTGGAEFGTFLIRRVGRLWPLHISVLVLMVALEFVRLMLASRIGGDTRAAFSGETDLMHLLPNAFLVHGWYWNTLNWNVPSWSISAELFAYIVFGAVLVLARSRTVLVAGIIFAVAWLVSVSIAGNTALYSGLTSLRAVAGFFAGVLVYAAYTRMGRPNWSLLRASVLEIGAVALVVGYLLFISRHELTPWATPVFVVAVYVFAADQGVISSLLRSRPLQLLGTLSYSIYLTHSLVITAFNALSKAIGKVLDYDTSIAAPELFPGATEHGITWDITHYGNLWLDDLYVLAFLATVIGLSALTYRFIEVPGQRLFAGFAAQRKLRRPATAS